MTPNLEQMTNAELKRYISENRNDDEAFNAALQVLMSRCDPKNTQPYPLDLENPMAEIETLFRNILNKTD